MTKLRQTLRNSNLLLKMKLDGLFEGIGRLFNLGVESLKEFPFPFSVTDDWFGSVSVVVPISLVERLSFRVLSLYGHKFIF